MYRQYIIAFQKITYVQYWLCRSSYLIIETVPKEAAHALSSGGDKEKSDQDSDLEITRIEPTLSSNKNSSLNQFIFNIADGGFTELHTLWQVLLP